MSSLNIKPFSIQSFMTIVLMVFVLISDDKPCLVSNMNLRIKLDEGKNILKPSSSGRARFARIRDSESEDDENEYPKDSKKAERAKSKEVSFLSTLSVLY